MKRVAVKAPVSFRSGFFASVFRLNRGFFPITPFIGYSRQHSSRFGVS
jgi:hypothetical protein